MANITVGLIGNPNSGKSSTFNALTGGHEHVGNWPGKTVEKKEGKFKYKDYEINIVDLPGTYSLTAYSIEELVARNYIVDEHPDIVIDVIDSTNLERNLYLAVQLIEMGANLILAFNMTDLAKEQGLKINVKQISNYLNVPIIETVASKSIGMKELKDAIIETYEKAKTKEKTKKEVISYGKEVEEHLKKLTEVIDAQHILPEKYNSRWIALKLLEEDPEIIKLITNLDTKKVIINEAEKIKKHLEDVFGEEVGSVIADARYGFIHGIVAETVEKKEKGESFFEQTKKTLTKPVPAISLTIGTIIGLMFLFAGNQIMESSSAFCESISCPEWLTPLIVDFLIGGIGAISIYIPFVVLIFFVYGVLEKNGIIKHANTLSDHFDRITTNRIIGIPIFLLLMFITFNLIFNIAAPLSDFIDWFINDLIGGTTEKILTDANAPDWLVSLTTQGIINGVGTVMVFVPFIFMLFMIIAVLEDSGYLARAAFVMDRVMHKIGLHGKSFIPLMLGFGCNVPAVMATRILENTRDRILTILINPFMSCGARLPVYLLFAAAFFTGTIQIFGFEVDTGTIVVYSLYLLGIVVAIIVGLILKRILFKGLSSPFVMELPPYRMPTLKGVLIHTWERGWIFIKKAGTVIFGVVILIWFLAALPPGVEYGSEESYIGSIGKTIAPIFAPIGAGDWQSAVSLFFGFVAKEVVIGSMGVLYGIEDVESEEGENSLIAALHTAFTPLSAYAFLVFVLLYVPCLVTVATIKREIGWKWAILSVFISVGVAYIVAFAVYHVGLLLGLR